MLGGITLIAAGIIGVAVWFVKWTSKGKEPSESFRYIQRLTGVVLLIFGGYPLVTALWGGFFFNLIGFSLNGIIALLNYLVPVALGVALLFGMTDKYVMGEKADPARHVEVVGLLLARLQGPLGLIAILLGIWYYVWFAWMITRP